MTATTMATPRLTHTLVESPLGVITLVGTEQALTGLYLTGDTRRIPVSRLGERADHGFDRAAEQLAEYFAGERRTFDLALAPVGDVFAQRVWTLLQQIPYGETRSYGQLARELGDPGLARAVGHANGRNPVAIVVPCHRVIGSTGALTGYAAGLERKRWLLDHEQPPLVH